MGFNPLSFLFREGEGEVMGLAGVIFGIIIVIVAILIFYFSSRSWTWIAVGTAILLYGLYHLGLGLLHLNPVTNTALNVIDTAQDAVGMVKGAGKKRSKSKPRAIKNDYNAELWDKTDYENDGSALDAINENAMANSSGYETETEIRDDNVEGSGLLGDAASWIEKKSGVDPRTLAKDAASGFKDYMHNASSSPQPYSEVEGGSALSDAAKWAVGKSGIDPVTIMRTAITSVESYNPAVREFLNKARDGLHNMEDDVKEFKQFADADTTGQLKPLLAKFESGVELLSHLDKVLP